MLREQLCQALLEDHQSSVPVNCSKQSHGVPYHSSPCGFRSEGPPRTAKENRQSKSEFSKDVFLGLGLKDEVATEIHDTIHAILASLADSSASRPNEAQTNSSMKGKYKESVTEARSTPPSQNATSEDVVRSFDVVERIETALETLNDDFHFPTQLDFISTHLHDVGDALVKGTSRLAFSARNHPVRYYEQALTSLLSRLDSIDSFGNEALRTKRKEVVRRVETALDELERGIEASHKVASDASTHERKPEEAQVLPLVSDSMKQGALPDVNATGSSTTVFDDVATEKEDVISSSNAETISPPSEILTTEPEEGSSPSAVSVSGMSRCSDDEQEEEINASQPPSGGEVVVDAHAVLDVPIEAAVPIVPTVLNLGSPVEPEDVSAFLLTDVTDVPQSSGPLPSHLTDDLGSDWSDVEEEQS